MTGRLLGLLEENLTVIEGEVALHDPTVDLLEMPLPRLLNLVYFWGIRNGDENEIRKFDTRLWRPPPGEIPTEGPWSAEAETNAFRAFAKQIRGESPPDGPEAGSGQPRTPGTPVRASASPGGRRRRGSS